MRRLALILTLVALVCAAFAGSAGAASTKTWHVKVTNLTSGQPMSPPVWAVHDKHFHVWRVSELASSAVLPVVEDAFNTPILAYLSGNSHVFASRAETGTPAGPIPPLGSREFSVRSDGSDHYLSMLWMLVRTNDGFTGLDSYHLNGDPRTRTLLVSAYDGGTERNNQSCAFIPGPPCGNFFVRDPTAQPIAPHPGITAPSDIAAFAWTDPVARIEITRTK
jgi:hypothetical protein